jgi:hypothetical protein
MKEFVNKLRAQNNLCLGFKADARNNIAARKYLAEQGMAVFPDDFFSLVKYVNGIFGDGCRVYGIDPEEKHSVNDAVFQNEDSDRKDKNKISILGYNIFDYLVYDSSVNKYQFRDKIDDVIVQSFDNIKSAITILLGIK